MKPTTLPYETEAEIIEGIKIGLRDMDEGVVMSHADAMKKLRETIANPRPLDVETG